MEEPWAWFTRAAEALSPVTDRFVRAGALAANRYRSTERYTTDADILTEWREDLVPALEAAGYRLRAHADPGEHPHLLMARQDDLGNVDFIIATVDYQEAAIDRGRADHVLTVEDVLIHKLIAWRPKDQDDVASILAAGESFDENYIARWAAEWDVTDRWASVRWRSG